MDNLKELSESSLKEAKKTVRIVTYNVNGLRAALKKDWLGWLTTLNPDIVCLQEIKCLPIQVPLEDFEAAGYHTYWFPAQKLGYSGVAIFSKEPALHVETGCGHSLYDSEGRMLRADFEKFSVISLYLPSGSSKEERQQIKMEFLHFLDLYTSSIINDKENLIISGDYNICHKEIDIHDPVSNKNSSGFLPEEREWMTNFLASGFTDAFRKCSQEAEKYTWWSYRMRARQRNRGWRIDYHMVSNKLVDKIKSCTILSDAVHSDHCPVLLEMEI